MAKVIDSCPAGMVTAATAVARPGSLLPMLTLRGDESSNEFRVTVAVAALLPAPSLNSTGEVDGSWRSRA